MTQPLARWLAIVSIAWLVLAPTALRIAMAASPSAPPWQQICTSHGEQSTQSGAPGVPNQGGMGACDCPLCVLCHFGWGAPLPAVALAAYVPRDGASKPVADSRAPRRAWPWALPNPRAPPTRI